ncbi:hypothetical protein MHYP_G00278250 [Metynnis hypsauchen]
MCPLHIILTSRDKPDCIRHTGCGVQSQARLAEENRGFDQKTAAREQCYANVSGPPKLFLLRDETQQQFGSSVLDSRENVSLFGVGKSVKFAF